MKQSMHFFKNIKNEIADENNQFDKIYENIGNTFSHNFNRIDRQFLPLIIQQIYFEDNKKIKELELYEVIMPLIIQLKEPFRKLNVNLKDEYNFIKSSIEFDEMDRTVINYQYYCRDRINSLIRVRRK
jgi:hypothetical protein